MAYFGTILGKLTATLGMIAAAAHTAVWLGASTPDAHRWVQAGLEGSRPWAYIEVGTGSRQVSIREWPVAANHLAYVRLRHRGNRWQVVIDGRHSRWLCLRRGVAITTLETDGLAAAFVDGRIIHGK